MTDILDTFVNKKKADSPYLTLVDGDSAVVKKLKEIKSVTKAGFGGEEKDVLRFILDVETSEGIREKIFDNGTSRFAQELKEKGVKVGCGFTITRNGQQTKTRYTITNVNTGIVNSAPATPIVEPSAK